MPVWPVAALRKQQKVHWSSGEAGLELEFALAGFRLLWTLNGGTSLELLPALLAVKWSV